MQPHSDITDDTMTIPSSQYAGRPCRRNHNGMRYASNAGCVACARLARDEYNKRNAMRVRHHNAARMAAKRRLDRQIADFDAACAAAGL